MQKKLTLILILILVLAQLCACGKPQAEPSPAAESEAAAPAELPEEEAPDEPDEPAGRTPDRVLTSTKYTAEVYIETTQYGQYQIESREYAVSDGVSAAGLRAAGRGSYIRFFDQKIPCHRHEMPLLYSKNTGSVCSRAAGCACSQTGKYGANLPKALYCTSYQKNTVHGNWAGGWASKTASPFPSGKESR